MTTNVLASNKTHLFSYGSGRQRSKTSFPGLKPEVDRAIHPPSRGSKRESVCFLASIPSLLATSMQPQLRHHILFGVQIPSASLLREHQWLYLGPSR